MRTAVRTCTASPIKKTRSRMSSGSDPACARSAASRRTKPIVCKGASLVARRVTSRNGLPFEAPSRNRWATKAPREVTRKATARAPINHQLPWPVSSRSRSR
jgi:hypothetical protein